MRASTAAWAAAFLSTPPDRRWISGLGRTPRFTGTDQNTPFAPTRENPTAPFPSRVRPKTRHRGAQDAPGDRRVECRDGSRQPIPGVSCVTAATNASRACQSG